MGKGPPQKCHQNWLIPKEAKEITSSELNFTKRNDVEMQKILKDTQDNCIPVFSF